MFWLSREAAGGQLSIERWKLNLTCQRIVRICKSYSTSTSGYQGRRTLRNSRCWTARTEKHLHNQNETDSAPEDMSIGIVLKRKKASSNNTLPGQQMLTINTHKITHTYNRTQSQSHTNSQTQTAHTDRIGKQNTKPLDNRSNTTTTDTIEERTGTYWQSISFLQLVAMAAELIRQSL